MDVKLRKTFSSALLFMLFLLSSFPYAWADNPGILTGGGAAEYAQGQGIITANYGMGDLVALALLANIFFNVIRYMLADALNDEQTANQVKADVINNVGVALLVGSMFVILGGAEKLISMAFGNEAYSDFLSQIKQSFVSIQKQMDHVVATKEVELKNLYVRNSKSFYWLGIPVRLGGCWFASKGIHQQDCFANLQIRMAKISAIIDKAMDMDIASVVAATVWDFFFSQDYNLAGWLLVVGMAYYAFDITRPAGAAMITIALGAYYVYPVTYQAFLVSPRIDISALLKSSTVLNIASARWCGISTFPSSYITYSKATVQAVQQTSASSPSAATKILVSDSNLLQFLNDLYFNFLIRHGVALAVTFLFIYHTYLILTRGMLGSVMLRKLGGFI